MVYYSSNGGDGERLVKGGCLFSKNVNKWIKHIVNTL